MNTANKFQSAIVGIDAYDDKSLQYNGYINFSRGTWNGWDMPWLDEESAKRFIKKQQAFIESCNKKQLEYEQEFHDEIMAIEPKEITAIFDGVECTKTLYDFGILGICWEVYEENE